MITIRNIQPADLQVLAEVYSKTYEAFDVGEKWTPETALQLLRYWFERQPDLAFLAEEDGEILGGFFAAVKPWWDGMHLVDGELFVHPDHQKKKIGTMLSKHMFTQAMEKYQAQVWDTYTFKNTEHPLKWYKAQGFDENKDWVMISGDLKEALKRLK
ncbi:MAG: GNAT family N-acetyltransferase [Candidatus Buchananbacteria bacterium]|nr:GNAT family N-acetyltransferase [Candidatus Buchananbacteria bacterium]